MISRQTAFKPFVLQAKIYKLQNSVCVLCGLLMCILSYFDLCDDNESDFRTDAFHAVEKLIENIVVCHVVSQPFSEKQRKRETCLHEQYLYYYLCSWECCIIKYYKIL